MLVTVIVVIFSFEILKKKIENSYLMPMQPVLLIFVNFPFRHHFKKIYFIRVCLTSAWKIQPNLIFRG